MFERYLNRIMGFEFINSEPMEIMPVTKAEFSMAKQLINDFNAQEIINSTELYKDFKAVAPDLARKLKSEELYYALKNGFMVEEVPSKLIYYCKKAYNKSKCANAVPCMLPSALTENVFTLGYLKNGWTLVDVIRTFCDPKFELLRNVGSYCITKAGAEFLLSEEPEYALVPHTYLANHDVSKLTVSNGKLLDEYRHEVSLDE